MKFDIRRDDGPISFSVANPADSIFGGHKGIASHEPRVYDIFGLEGTAMSDTPLNSGLFHTRLRGATTTLFWLGLATVALGIVAIVFPMISTLVATLLVGWVFLVSGIFLFFGSFSIHGTGPFFGALLLGLLSIVAGFFLLFNPFPGEAALTLWMGVIFMVQSAFELTFAFEMRPNGGWIAMLISGIASLVLAILIAAGWPAISTIVLGILLGINLLTSGSGYIIVSRAIGPAA